MAWSTAICPVCCNPPQVAVNASEVAENNRNLTQYIYASTIQGQRQVVNPNYRYQYKSQTERIQALMGRVSNPQAVAMRSNGGVGCQCTAPVISDLIITSYDYSVPNWIIYVSWTAPLENSYTYTFTTNQSDGVFTQTGSTTATLTTEWPGPGDIEITVLATTSCGTSTVSNSVAPCFLAGSLVTMADGSEKVIEDVQIGDMLLGAFGEHNEVLALHRPLLGNTLMCKINGEHSTTNHHPHVAIDKKFYSNDPVAVDEKTYGREHEVIGAGGVKEMRMLHGLKKGRVEQLELGVILKVVSGDRVVDSLETYSMPPETQLYNLVMGGSHTYHVDGYAVTGWPREDDFNYDSWTPQ
jgi:hypothetical protein